MSTQYMLASVIQILDSYLSNTLMLTAITVDSEICVFQRYITEQASF